MNIERQEFTQFSNIYFSFHELEMERLCASSLNPD